VAIEAFKLLSVALKPVLPETAAKVEQFLNLDPLTWTDLSRQLPDWHRINPYTHLIVRIEPDKVKAMVEASKET